MLRLGTAAAAAAAECSGAGEGKQQQQFEQTKGNALIIARTPLPRP